MTATEEEITSRREHESEQRAQAYRDFWQYTDADSKAYARRLAEAEKENSNRKC